MAISRYNSYIKIHPGALLVKTGLKIGLFGAELCFRISGEACCWAFE